MGKKNISLKVFLDSIESYTYKFITDSRLSVRINNGLRALNQLPSSSSVSLFLLNENTYDFEHCNTEPSEETDTIKNIYTILIDNGIIGEALTSDKFPFHTEKITDTSNEYYLVVPLPGSEKILGIVIIKLTESPEEIEPFISQVFRIFIKTFACSIENAYFKANQDVVQGVVDQKVASRTMDLVKSKKMLVDKFDHLRTDLSMSIPHEIRTPISLILGYSDYLKQYLQTTDLAESKEMLSNINGAARRLQNLFENYIYFANLSILSTDPIAIQALFEQVTFSVDFILSDVVLYKAELKDRKDDVKLNIQDAPVHMGEEYFRKIIEELIDNCLKYSNPNEQIVVSSEIEGSRIHLSFTDHGRGMTDEQIANIDAYMQFDRKFYEQQGAGLGISIVRKIVDLHNGEFYIESKVNEYTTVNIKLDIVQDSE